MLIGRGGNDTLDGGGGMDRADYRNDVGGITVTYTASGNTFDATVIDGLAATDTLISIEQVRGSQFDDVFNGNDANNRFRGEGGADIFNIGDDPGFGGSANGGNDRIEYTLGTYESNQFDGVDTINGFGTGNDVISFGGLDGLELMTVNYGFDTTLQTTIDNIIFDDGVQDRVVFFTDFTDGWIYVKGRGTGTTSYDGTLIKLQGVTAPLAAGDVIGAGGAALIATTGGTDTIIATAAQETHIGGAGSNYFVFTATADSPDGTPDAIADFNADNASPDRDFIVLEGIVADGDDFQYEGFGDGLLSSFLSGLVKSALGTNNILGIDVEDSGVLDFGADIEIDLTGITGTLDIDDFIIITTTDSPDSDDAYVGRTGNDWILASTTSTFATDHPRPAGASGRGMVGQ